MHNDVDRPEPLAVSVKEACRILSIGRTTAFRLFRERLLERRKIGARTVVTMESIRNLLARGEA